MCNMVEKKSFKNLKVKNNQTNLNLAWTKIHAETFIEAQTCHFFYED